MNGPASDLLFELDATCATVHSKIDQADHLILRRLRDLEFNDF